MTVFLMDEMDGLLNLNEDIPHDDNDEYNSGAISLRLQCIPRLFKAKELECGECLRFVDENDNTVFCGSQIAILKKELDILDRLCSTGEEQAEASGLRLLTGKFDGSEEDIFLAFVCDETVKAQHPYFIEYDKEGLPINSSLKKIQNFATGFRFRHG